MRSRRIALATFFVLLGVASVRGEESPAIAGLAAYFSGRFDEAAVGLKHSLRSESDRKTAEVSLGATAYFLGRSFHELGLRGLALHYFGQAEFSREPTWRLLARRELVRAYYEIGDFPAVMRVFDREAEDSEDGEISYFAGLAAAELVLWSEAEKILSRVEPGHPFFRYAVYARAQARAAKDDLTGALGDLDQVVALPDPPAGRRRGPLAALFGAGPSGPTQLRNQAQLLRGKILYLQGRGREAQGAFGAVDASSGLGFEALRGLVLTGAPAGAADKVEVPVARAVDASALLAVKAAAAEERNDLDSARKLRQELGGVARKRLEALERLASDSDRAAEEALEGDLAGFWRELREARWRERWIEERPLLSKGVISQVEAKETRSFEQFAPKEGAFYGVWDRSRSDRWLRGLIELRSRAATLGSDLETGPAEKPIWAFWRSDDDQRLAVAILAIRLVNLQQLFADHLHTFDVLTDDQFRPRKRGSVAAAIAQLDRLYVGDRPKIPEQLSNLAKALEYKRGDMLRLIDSVPERSTDPDISLCGNYVDLLADMRARLSDGGEKVVPIDDVAPGLLEAWRVAEKELAAEISSQIRRAIAPTLKRQIAFFLRVEADNEGSLSRLLARRAESGPRARGETSE